MALSTNKDTIVSIPYFNDAETLKELIKFLQKLLLKKGVDKVYVDKISELSKDEIVNLHLTHKMSPMKDLKSKAERYVHDYFILKENYLKEQLGKGKNRKKSEEFVTQMSSEVVPQPINMNNNIAQNQMPQAVIRQAPQRVKKGSAPVARQQSATNLYEQIAQINLISRQLQQLRLANQTQQLQIKTTPSNRQMRAQKQEMEKQESHRLIPRPTLNVFNKLMAEQELARKKKEEQELAALKKNQEQELLNKNKMSMRPKTPKPN